MNASHKRIALFMLAAALWSLATSSCNTMKGIGEDIENAGRSLKESAQ